MDRRDPFGEELGVAQELPQAGLVVALVDRRVAVHRDAQGAGAEAFRVRRGSARPRRADRRCGRAAEGRGSGDSRWLESSVAIRRPPRAAATRRVDRGYDDRVTDRRRRATPDRRAARADRARRPAEPARRRPGERRLAHPPSDRYRAAEAARRRPRPKDPTPVRLGRPRRRHRGGDRDRRCGRHGRPRRRPARSRRVSSSSPGRPGLFVAYALQVGAAEHLTSPRGGS